MVLLLREQDTGHQQREQLGDGGHREPTRGLGVGSTLEIRHADREQALDRWVQDDHADTAEAGMQLDASKRQAQPIPMVGGIDNGDRLRVRGRPFNGGIV